MNSKAGYMQEGVFTQTAIIILIGMLLVVSSCSPSRRAMREPLKEVGTEFIVAGMKTNQIDHDFLSARLSGDFQQGRTAISFSGQMRLKRDSIIWITVSPALGIEAARIVLTIDSLKFLNRLQGTYFLASIDELSRQLHPALNFDLIQSLLLGNDLSLYDDSQFTAGIDKNQYRLSVTNRRLKKLIRSGDEREGLPAQVIWLEPNTFRITQMSIHDKSTENNPSIDANYSVFADVGGQKIATSQKYSLENDRNKIGLQLKFNRIETSPITGFPFSVPETYQVTSPF